MPEVPMFRLIAVYSEAPSISELGQQLDDLSGVAGNHGLANDGLRRK